MNRTQPPTAPRGVEFTRVSVTTCQGCDYGLPMAWQQATAVDTDGDVWVTFSTKVEQEEYRCGRAPQWHERWSIC
jgi:hypothetical protein